MANEQVTVRFAAEIQQYQANVKQAQKLLSMFGITAEQESNRVARSVASMVAQYASLTLALNAVKNVVKEGINFNKFVEVSTAAFGTMMKSVSGAKAVMQDLFNFAVNSPLTFKETVASSRQLMAYGFQVKELIPTIQMLGTVGKATGVALDDMAYVYGTLRSQGRAYTRDLMQFAMRGIPIYEELAEVMGRPVQDLQKLTEAGKIGFKEVEKAFQNMTSGTGKFAGYFDEYMKTFEGKMSMLSDIAQQASGTLTESLFGVLKTNVDDFIKILKNNKATIASIGTDLGKLASAFFDIVKAVLPLIPLLLKLIPLLIAKEVLSGGMKVWKALPEVFNALSGTIAQAAAKLTLFASGQASTTLIGLNSTVAMLGRSFTSFGTSIATALPAIISAAASIGAIVAGVTLLIGIKAKSDELQARWKTDPAFARETINKTKGISYVGLIDTQGQIKLVRQLQETYSSLSVNELATILYQNKAISSEAYDYYLALEEGTKAEQMRAASSKAYSEFSWDAVDALKAQKALADDEAWKKALSEFQKYKDAYEKWQASTSGDPYAMIDYEYNKNKEIIKEKLGAYPTIYNTAIEWITKQYQYERDQIGATEAMKSKYGKYTGLISSGQTTVDQAFFPEKSMANQVQVALSEMDRTLASEEDVYMENLRAQLSALLPLLQEIERLADKEVWKTIQNEIAPPLSAWEGVVKQFNEYSDKIKNMDMTPKERAEAEVALYNWAMREKLRIAKEEFGNEGEDWISVMSRAFDYLLKGSSDFWNQFKANMVMALKNKDIKGILGNVAMLSMKDTYVGQVIQGYEARKAGGEGNAPMSTGDNLLATGALIAADALSLMVKFILDIVMAAKPMQDLLKAITTSVAYALMPVIETLANGLSWLYDSIIVPVGNFIIDIINAIIRFVNKVLGWAGVNINEMNHLLTTTQALAKAQEDAARQLKLSKSMDAFGQTLDYLKNKLNATIDTQVKSLQDLYEVGAISAQDYQGRVGALNANRPAGLENMVSIADQQLATMQEVSTRIGVLLGIQQYIKNNKLTDDQALATLMSAGITENIKPLIANPPQLTVDLGGLQTDVTNTINTIVSAGTAGATPTTTTTTTTTATAEQIAAAKLQIDKLGEYTSQLNPMNHSYASGTGYIPQDMPANVHKGEMIIPSDFSSAIRRGDLSLSGSSPSGGAINVVVNVAGSVKEENDLAKTIANAIYRQRRAGLVTV